MTAEIGVRAAPATPRDRLAAGPRRRPRTALPAARSLLAVVAGPGDEAFCLGAVPATGSARREVPA
ncbi:MAG: hypothetical protein JWR24_5306 [Actinoallomurus sp.]|jgi:hypothetical protein|nr:hypothetical protein [Actinoallomurus sp.]